MNKGLLLVSIIFLTLTAEVNGQILDTCIINRKASVFEKPDVESKKVGFFENGDKVQVLGKIKTFYEISSGEVEGYVQYVSIECDEENFSQSYLCPRGTRTIVVNFKSDTIDYFELIVQRFIELGYGIDKYDRDMGFIQTSPSSSKKMLGEVVFYVGLRDNQFTIRGDFNSPYQVEIYGVRTTNTWEEIKKRGMKGSISMDAFEEMLFIASSFKGTKLEYLKY